MTATEYLLAIDEISRALVLDVKKRDKIQTIVNNSIEEWKELLLVEFPEWPSVDIGVGAVQQAAVNAVVSLCAAAYFESKSKITPSWVISILGDFEPFTVLRNFPKETLSYLKTFFSKPTIYGYRQLQLEFKSRLALVGPKNGFLARHFLDSEEVDEDVEYSTEEKLWKKFSPAVELFLKTVCTLDDPQNISGSMHLIVPPLLQLLDDARTSNIESALEVANHLLSTLSSQELSQNFFNCVLLEAVLDKYWVWSIDPEKDPNSKLYARELLETIELMLEKDNHRQDMLEEQLKFEKYLESRKSNPKKTSETRIYPNMPWLAKVEIFWNALLQSSITLRQGDLIHLHFDLVKKYGNVLGKFIERNFKAIVKLASIHMAGADFKLGLEMVRYMRESMAICKENLPKCEGEILVALVDFGNQLADDEVKQTLGEYAPEFENEMVIALDFLIETLVDMDETRILRNDWEALMEVEKLNLDWAMDSFKKLFYSCR